LSLLAVSRTPDAVDPWDQVDLSGTLAEATQRTVGLAEKRKLIQALRDAGADRGRAADLLDINFKTLSAKLREHGLD
jgi:DNA-binding NtrC family response regulator